MNKSQAILLAAVMGIAGVSPRPPASITLATLFPGLGNETERMKRAEKRARRETRERYECRRP